MRGTFSLDKHVRRESIVLVVTGLLLLKHLSDRLEDREIGGSLEEMVLLGSFVDVY